MLSQTYPQPLFVPSSPAEAAVQPAGIGGAVLAHNQGTNHSK